MNTDNTYANFLKTEMAKVLSERDKIKDQREQALRLLAEKTRELEFVKRENKVLKERFDEAVKQLGARRLASIAVRQPNEEPTFLPLGNKNNLKVMR